MSKKLPSDFSAEKYGLSVRLVNESDTDFILSLRTDKELSKYLHQTDEDVKKHLKWYNEYKTREIEGRDYYFIYHKDGKPVGLNRIYNICDYYGTIGSWICPVDNDPETSIGTYFFMLDILFEQLSLSLSVFDVRKNNTHVWKLHKIVGAQSIGESDVDYYFYINKQTYINNREKLLQLFNLK